MLAPLIEMFALDGLLAQTLVGTQSTTTDGGTWSLFDLIQGEEFNTFFRGLLSVLVGVVVLIGGTYLIVATNTGARTGFMISAAGLFGWMFLMGIIWTAYGIGWRGEEPTWELVEMNIDDPGQNDDGLIFSQIDPARSLASVDIAPEGIEDPDEAQDAALAQSKEADLDGWRYLVASDGVRGEAQASANQFLLDEEIYAAGEFLPTQFGGFGYGGKPLLKEDANVFDRFVHYFDETLLHPLHPQELIVVQVQGVVDRPSLPGEAPPVAEIDAEEPLVSVVMERDRGGPIPSLLSGRRFKPLRFTVISGALFALFSWLLHSRDRRIDAIRAATAKT